MVRHRLLHLGVLLGATALLQGCFGSDSTSGPADDPVSDEVGIENVIFQEETDWADPDVRWFDDGQDAAAAPINTHFWRRELLSLDRSVTIQIENPDGEPPTASVTMEADATGLLHLVGCTDSELLHVTKDFDDHAVRSMFFKKVRRADRPHRGWALLEISGVLIQSEDTSRNLDWVRLQAGDVDVTIEDVTSLIPREEILRLPPNSEVVVTASTGDSTDEVYLHLRHWRRRLELASNDDGTFSGRFRTAERSGLCHLVVDVLSDGTINDDEAAYDNIAWGVPYVVRAELDDSADLLASND